jgi:hypothetical protein
MNRVLYLLAGGCVGVALVAAYFGKAGAGTISENETIAAVLLATVYAVVCLFFMYARQGRTCRAWLDESLRRGEDKVRSDIRDKGKVPPPWPPL